MKLGGWWRIWIVFAGLHAVVVILVAIQRWPTVAEISHHPSFNYRLSDASQKVLARPKAFTNAELEQKLIEADKQGAKDEARMYALMVKERRSNPWKESSYVLEMPNGHKFDVSADSADAELRSIGKEYTQVLASEVPKERAWAAFYAFLWWLGPVATVCALGLLCRWVFRGFKSPR